MPYFERLPEVRQAELLYAVHVLLEEKHFEGCGGFDLDEHAQLRVAGYAGLLLLNRSHDYFPLLKAILIYPTPFVPQHDFEDEYGFVDEEAGPHEGESWDWGTVILSWEDIERDIAEMDGRNVILHEFAHQIFDSGDLHFPNGAASERFNAALERQYKLLVKAAERERPTFLDPYGAEDPAEFFSVVVEAFFEQPRRFHHRHPELYAVLCEAFRQDPRDYFPAPDA